MTMGKIGGREILIFLGILLSISVVAVIYNIILGRTLEFFTVVKTVRGAAFLVMVISTIPSSVNASNVGSELLASAGIAGRTNRSFTKNTPHRNPKFHGNEMSLLILITYICLIIVVLAFLISFFQ